MTAVTDIAKDMNKILITIEVLDLMELSSVTNQIKNSNIWLDWMPLNKSNFLSHALTPSFWQQLELFSVCNSWNTHSVNYLSALQALEYQSQINQTFFQMLTFGLLHQFFILRNTKSLRVRQRIEIWSMKEERISRLECQCSAQCSKKLKLQNIAVQTSYL